MRDPQSVQRAVVETKRRLSGIDILVNNAGITGPNVKLWDYPLDDWRSVMAVNVDGPFVCSKAVVPAMRRAQLRTDREYRVRRRQGR